MGTFFPVLMPLLLCPLENMLLIKPYEICVTERGRFKKSDTSIETFVPPSPSLPRSHSVGVAG